MEHRELLEIKLSEISKILEKKYKDLEDIGILGGISGILLFQFYHSKFLNVDRHADISIEILSACISKINNGYSSPTYCSGIAGFGWVLDHLKQENFVELNNDDLLSELDAYLY